MRNQFRKAQTILTFILVLLSLCEMAYALSGNAAWKTFRVRGAPVSVSLPKDYIVLTRDMPRIEYAENNYSSLMPYDDFMELCQEKDAFLYAFPPDFSTKIFMTMNKDPSVVFTSDLYMLDEYGIRDIAKKYADDFRNRGFSLLDWESIDAKSARYIKMELDDRIVYKTILSGRLFLFVMTDEDGGGLSDAERALLDEIVMDASYYTLPNRYDLLTLAVVLMFFAMPFLFVAEIFKARAKRKAPAPPPKKKGPLTAWTDRLLERQWVKALIWCMAVVGVNSLDGDAFSNYLSKYTREEGVFLYITLCFFALSEIMLMIFLVMSGLRKRRERVEEERRRMEEQFQRNQEAEKVPPGQTILYLRPFRADANSVVSRKTKTGKRAYASKFKKRKNSFGKVDYRGEKLTHVEAVICKALENDGVPIAIGDPKEKELHDSPLDGAGRLYATNDTWKTVVENFFIRSKTVVLYTDFTKGVRWELDLAIQKYRDKVIFIPKLYNQHTRFLRNLAYFPLTALLFYPIYFIFVKLLLLPGWRRGPLYGWRWKKRFGFPITDRVCAVRFEGDKPVCYDIRSGDLEAQLEGIVRAIRNMGSIPKEKFPAEKDALSLPVSMARENRFTLQDRVMADGVLTFADEGLSYHQIGWINWLLTLSAPMQYSVYKPLLRWDMRYSEIYAAKAFPEMKSMEIDTESVNGRYFLTVPSGNEKILGEISSFLEKRSPTGNPSAEELSLSRWRLQKIADKFRRDAATSCAILLTAAIFLLSLNFWENFGVGFVLSVSAYVSAKQARIKWLSSLSLVLELSLGALIFLSILLRLFSA